MEVVNQQYSRIHLGKSFSQGTHLALERSPTHLVYVTHHVIAIRARRAGNSSWLSAGYHRVHVHVPLDGITTASTVYEASEVLA